MKFEFDAEKSTANAAKHGIDFEQAQRLWEDENLAIAAVREVEDEMRDVYIGRIEGKHWVAVATQRGRALRIISVRRARRKEIEIYESFRI